MYLCVYLPYEKNADSVDEFIYQLSVIESVFNHGDSCHVIVAGDFNTDFNRQSVYTAALQDFCLKSDMYPIRDHSSCLIDYTYNFNMKTSFIDHFLLSNQLFHTGVSKACVMHDMDNVSDHDVVCLYLVSAWRFGVRHTHTVLRLFSSF